jgi:putative endonuclease
MPFHRAELGAAGESAATERYRARGYRVLERNWRCPAGEIDLIVLRDGVLVVCEVKTRRGAAFGGGYESVTSTKQRKLRQLAERYVRANRLDPRAIRFDVASVAVSASGATDVEVYEDAF